MKTNLEKAGSITKACRTYLKPEGVKAFVAWCKAPCEQILPGWLKVGKWFTRLGTDRCYKIAEITDGFVYTTRDSCFPVDHITEPEMAYRPITIKPWSLTEAEAVMRARTCILIDDKTIKLSEVLTRYEDEGNLIIVESNIDGTRYSTSYLAEYGETDAHQPCGTAIPCSPTTPIYQKETSND